MAVREVPVVKRVARAAKEGEEDMAVKLAA